MSGPPKGWRSGKATRAYFASQGIEVSLSTITRQYRAKHPNLFQKHGRTVFVDAVELLKRYRDDYRAAMHAGELGADKVSRLEAKPESPVAEYEPPAEPEEPAEEEDRFKPPSDPIKRKAWLQAQKMSREEAEAQKVLVPASDARAAIAFAIGEGKSVHQKAIQPAAERIAAMFRDDGRALEVKAIIDDVMRSGWNAFAAAAARHISDSDPAGIEDFKKLQALAEDLADQRRDGSSGAFDPTLDAIAS